jgi:myo-inositol-1(or 4)-monophosphatase
MTHRPLQVDYAAWPPRQRRGGILNSADLLATALAAAREAAAVHRAHCGRVRIEDWSEKGISDFVTFVDREAEAGILQLVGRHYPGHTLLAEEAESARTGTGAAAALPADWVWIIDPLDGTTNYLHGYPMYAVSIGVAHRGELVVAVVLNSASGEEWTAVRGGGAFRNGERIRVSEIDTLARALVGTGFPFKALDLLPQYTIQLATALRGTSGVRRAGSAALDLCHVASGWFDGFWELTLAPWDVAAGTLVVREAGGVVTRLDGDPDVLGHGSILAGNPSIHAALGGLIRGAAQE